MSSDDRTARLSRLVYILKKIYCYDLRIFVPKVVTSIFLVGLISASPNILGSETLVLNVMKV